MIALPRVAAIGLAAFGSAAVAPAGMDGDPLQSVECRQALDALQAAEAAIDETRVPGRVDEAASGRLAPQRRKAAQACLGGRPDPPPRPRHPTAPIRVPPAVVAPPAMPLPAPPPMVSVPSPVSPRAPAIVTSCDAQGCWASDGTRLQRAGPQLIGPRGFCTTNGALLNCP